MIRRFGDIRNGAIFRVDPTGSVWYLKEHNAGAEGEKYNAKRLYDKNNPIPGKLINMDLHEKVWLE